MFTALYTSFLGGEVRPEEALYDACHSGDIREVERLVRSGGASVRTSNSAGNSPIHAAALRGDLTILEILASAGGADVRARGARGNTPLHLAAGRGHTDAVRWLLRKGADPTTRNEAGFSPAGVVRELLGELAREGASEDEAEAARELELILKALHEAPKPAAGGASEEEVKAALAMARGAHLPPPPSSVDREVEAALLEAQALEGEGEGAAGGDLRTG